jgi:hypothetical protein
MANEFDKYLNQLSEKDRAGIDKLKGQFEKDGTPPKDVAASNMEADKEATYKANTGRELNPTNDPNAAKNPITEDIGKQAKEAAEPVKNDVKPEPQKEQAPTEPPATTPPPQQRNNEFTKLDEAKPKDQQPAEKQKDQEKDR